MVFRMGCRLSFDPVLDRPKIQNGFDLIGRDIFTGRRFSLLIQLLEVNDFFLIADYCEEKFFDLPIGL